MPEPGMNEAADVLYKPGYSFTNPRLVKTAAPVRSNPWFWEPKGVGPLSASNKLRRWENTPQLKEYSAIWNRQAKQRNMDRLGAYFHDVPTMQELGAAPAASGETSAVVRSSTGFLDNLLTTMGQAAGGVTDMLTKQEAQKTQVAQARAQSYYSYLTQPFSSGGDSTWLLIAGVGILGVGAYLYFRR